MRPAAKPAAPCAIERCTKRCWRAIAILRSRFVLTASEGAVAYPGQSSLKVHGTFRIHGVDREITVPAEAEISATNWTATVHFTIPYEKWGMKNPSNLF